jgi:SAM-dependent methyltransferase
MNNTHAGAGQAPAAGGTAPYYKKDFWQEENLKFSKPWYRLEKTRRLVADLAGTRACDLLDIGCGPAALMPLVPANVRYHGIDIAIQAPASNLIEADLLESPIEFDGKTFDIIVAQGVFEYLGRYQEQKFAEIARLLNPGGAFLLTYTNFGHRKARVYHAISNVQPMREFRQSLARHFSIDRSFPVSYNWKPGHPSKRWLRAANMPLRANVPVAGPILAVEYYFMCSPQWPAT